MGKNPSRIQLYTSLWFLILAFILYGQSVNNGYNIDDNYVVEEHEQVQKGIKGIPDIFTSRYHQERDQYFGYRPLTIAVYAIEYQIFGNNPTVFHLLNILWYAVLLLVLFRLIRILIPGISFWFIIIALSIFAVHPIHSEVVLSLKNREEIFCFLLSALAWISFIRYYDMRKWYHLMTGLVLLALAFLAKETAVIFVAIIPLSLYYFRMEHTKQAEVRSGDYQAGKSLRIITGILQLVFLAGVITEPDFLSRIIGDAPATFLFLLLFLLVTFYLMRRQHGSISASELKRPLIVAAILIFVTGMVFLAINKDLTRWLVVLSLLFTGLHAQFPDLSAQIKGIKISKAMLIAIGIALISGVVLFIIHLVPEMSLPEKNAPVYNWQNPLFADKSAGSTLGVAFYSLAWYLKLLFLPYPLRFYYGYAMVPAAGLSHPVVIISILLHAALVWLMFRGMKERKIWSFAIAFYLIGILPFANLFFPLTGIIAERLLFIPSLGFSLIVAWLIFRIVKENPYTRATTKKTGILLLSLLLVLPFSIITIKRNADWKNRKTLYQADIGKLEKSAKANNLVANYLIGEVYAGMKAGVPLQRMDKKIHQSIDYYQQAIAVDSTYPNPLHNLGYIYLIIGREYPKAEQYFSRCLRIDSTVTEAWLNRGVARYYQEEYKQAKRDLQHCIQSGLEKDMDKAFYYLGMIAENQGDTTKAIAMYDSVLTYSPEQPKSLEKLQNLYAADKAYQKALEYNARLRKKASPKNDQVWVDKGNLHLMSGDTVQAIQAWEKAFAIFPGNYNIGMTLAGYYEDQGMRQKANAIRKKAVEFQRQQGKKQARR
jgi:tetratricopeptide (TPR) repeat protein